jgi:hypothetical protein
MSSEKNFRIVVTDGKNIKEVMWIRHTGKELCIGQVIEDMDFHWTYHEDGTFHYKVTNIKNKVPIMYPFPDQKLLPLDQFKGEKQLFFASSSSDFAIKNSIRDYNFGDYDEVVFIDVRTCRGKKFNMSVHLVEPNKLDLLKPEFFGERTHTHVLTSIKPWLVIITI